MYHFVTVPFDKVPFSTTCRFIMLYHIVTVPDPGSQDRDVVLASAGLLGKPERGVGNLEQGGNGEGMRKGRSVYEQPGTKVDRVASHQRRVSK
jgi:hypothetical protein